jgi:hypothetical protein
VQIYQHIENELFDGLSTAFSVYPVDYGNTACFESRRRSTVASVAERSRREVVTDSQSYRHMG